MKKAFSLLMSMVLVLTSFFSVPVYAVDNATENAPLITDEKYDNLKALDDCEVVLETDPEKLGRLVGGVEDVCEDITIDTENNDKADIVAEDVNVPLSAILENEGSEEEVIEVAGELGNTIVRDDDVIINSVGLKQLGYEYFINDKKITLSKSYQTKRLIVDIDELDDDFGATMAVSCGDGKALLVYDSIEATVDAQECFERDGVEAYPDRVVTIQAAIDLSGEWGCETVESRRFISERLANQGKEIVVAVVDTGVYYKHSFLKGRLLEGGNVINNKDYNDDNNHGTHVAGIIVNNTPENVKILPVKAFTSEGSSTNYLCALGVRYAVDHGADIINMSFGGQSESSDKENNIQSAIDYANEKGCLCVAAAGNESTDASEYWPASCDGVVTVGAVDSSDKLCGFSNYGDVVDVVAPGLYIKSSIAGGDKYDSFSGTSMATPFVCAVASLFLSENSKLTNNQLRDKIISSAIDLGIKGKDKVFGAGRIDLGYYLGDRMSADTITLKTKDIKLCHSEFFKASPRILMPEVTPKEATDKSYNYSFTNEGIINYDKGVFTSNAPGETTITLALDNGQSVSVDFTVTDGASWLDVAADKLGGGSGTMNDPYIIKTAEQLAKVSMDYYYNKYPYDVYFKQVADIDLGGRQWYPILCIDENRLHSRCNYDGGGYTISNLTFNQSASGIELLDVGLFYRNSGQMENINLVDVEINSDCSFAGGIAGTSNGIIRCCSVSGNIKSPLAGGIIGQQAPVNSSIYDVMTIDCYSDVKVTGSLVGGIAASLQSGYIANCGFFGSIITKSKEKLEGGIASDIDNWAAYEDGTGIFNCVSNKNIFATKEIYKSDGSNNSEKVGEQKSVVKNCYCLSDFIYSDKNPEDTDIKIVSESYFKNVNNFKNMRVDKYSWDTENIWRVDGNGIRLRPQKYRVRSGDYNYADLGDCVVIYGYNGKKSSITLPSYIDNKPVKYVGYKFNVPSQVKEITFSPTIDGICAMAFNECKNLIYVHLNEGLRLIGNHAFYNCELLQSVQLPESLEHLGRYALAYCSEMKNIFFKGSLDIVDTKYYLDLYSTATTRYISKYANTIDKKKWSGYKYSVYNPDHVLEISFNDYNAHYSDINISSQPTVSLLYGDSVKLKPRLYNNNAKNKKLIWSSSSGIKVTSDGTVKLEGEYNGIVTVKAADGSCQSSIYVQCAGCHPYKIVFKGNGATSGKMEAQSVPMYKAKNLNANKFVRTGYTFIGWATSPSGEVLYKNKEKVYALDQSRLGKTITLYAKWRANTYKVKYSANGGSGKMGTQSFTYNASKKLLANNFKAPKGKVFAGWSTSKNGTPRYTNGQSVKNLTAKKGATVTLYANWVTPRNYTITYKLNGGKQPSGYARSYTSGTGCKLPKPTKKGYKFAGWYTDSKCTKGKTTVIKPWITGNKTYYAKWVK